MKKIMIFLFCFGFLSATTYAQDKAFQKGTFLIRVGAGFAGYGTKATDVKDEWVWNGSAIVKERVTTHKNDGAASLMFPLTLEYGITNWFGAGLRGAYSKYYANADSTNNNTKPTVSSTDLGVMMNFHFIKTVHFDMPITLLVGYSGFSYKTNDVFNSMAKDAGYNIGVGLNPRIYFGDHVGMFFDLNYTSYTYPSLLFSNSNDSNLNDNANEVYTLKGNGANVGLGLIVKF